MEHRKGEASLEAYKISYIIIVSHHKI